MLFEVLLIMPLYTIFIVIFYRFRNIINVMEDINQFFSDIDGGTVDTPKVEQHNNREFLKIVINQGKADKLPGKTPWTIKRIDKATDSVIDMLYNDYIQNDIRNKAEKTGKAVGKHVVNLYSVGINRVLKIDSVEQLRKDIDEDPIIQDSMADFGALMMGTFGKFLASLLVAAYTVNRMQSFKMIR